jgi:hypothetical protein
LRSCRYCRQQPTRRPLHPVAVSTTSVSVAETCSCCEGDRLGRSRGGRRSNSLVARKFRDLTVGTLAAALAYVFFRESVSAVLWICFSVAAVGIWWLFLIPTYCDTVLRSDVSRLCTRHVRGKLRGCGQFHARDKRDAVWDLLNLRNPGMVFRVGWRPPAFVPRTTPAQSAAAVNAARETWMLILTGISAVAGVLGAIFTAVF